jgi:DNA-binding transcriptional LysR family regulator
VNKIEKFDIKTAFRLVDESSAMDIELARTFIAVMETRSFVRAAQKLFVTQSTISARIKGLEDQLGGPLFTRSKSGVAPTPAGAQFARHAGAIVRIWAQARQELALPAQYRARITIGSQITHWDEVLFNWMAWLRANHPNIAVRAELGSNEALMSQMAGGLLDAAVVYSPRVTAGLVSEILFEDALVLVASDRGSAGADDPAYVYVDWGPEFGAAHAAAFPERASPWLHFSVGTVALTFIADHGGAGYFPARMVRRHIEEQRLFPVSGAPRFQRPAYLVTAHDASDGAITDVLAGLRRIAAESVAPAS